MSSKKKLPTQPNKLQNKKPDFISDNTNVIESISSVITVPVETVKIEKKEEEYIPSLNSDKYPILKKKSQFSYKIIETRNDYVRLQNEVVEALNNGWQLIGGVSTSLYNDGYNVLMIRTQALFKEETNNF